MQKLRNIAKVGFVATLIAVVSGCSTAGPFVTNVSPDGKGGLVVEKNTVHLNSFTGVITLGETPTTQTIQILPQPDSKQK
jgi:type IV secretion system protein VirB7